MGSKILCVGLGALALAGCGSGKSANNVAAPANATAPANVSVAAAPATPAANGVVSDYTDINLAQCQSTSPPAQDGEEIADSGSWRCPGLGAIPIFISTGDLRYDVDAGVDNENFQTLPPFNENPTRIEWRKRGDAPFAIIFRLTLATNEASEWSGSALGVATIGTAGKPGCTIAWVDGNVPNANDVARRIADSQAASASCAGGEPQMIHRDNVPA